MTVVQSMAQRRQITRELLEELKRALLCEERPEVTKPSVEAMKSTAPFACDTMAFEQWLLFIFIPKMTALLDRRLALPANMALTPMAEETLDSSAHSNLLIGILQRVDAVVSGAE